MRKLHFINNEYYHIYNRGVDKRKIFMGFSHYRRFTKSIASILNTGSATPRLTTNQGLALRSKVEIIAYCLMPNHYHFLIHQLQDSGITNFMHNLNTSYTMFFNLNLKRQGRLFEFTFKAKHIDADELFLHIARYMHLNPVIAGVVDSVDLWPWSSYLDTIGERKENICSTEKILSFFNKDSPQQKYKEFVNDQRAYGQIIHDAQELKDEDMLFL